MRRAGRRFVNDAGVFRPRFVSGFRLPSRLMLGEQPHVERFFEWAVKPRPGGKRFNGVRVMCGGGWLNFSWSDPRTRPALRDLLLLAKDRGLYLIVTAFCNTAIDPVPNKKAVIREVATICNDAGNALLEIANETKHGTQDNEIHDEQFLLMLYAEAKAVAPNLCVALGAPDVDEPDATTGLLENTGGDWISLHLNRGRPLDAQACHIREMEAVSSRWGKPVMNNEPLGADEVLSQKQRYVDPDFAFTLGVLCEVMELGAVHHAEHGLHADLPGPNQERCADAFLDGGFLVDDALGELAFKNAQWGDSPVRDANFRERAQPVPDGTVWRVYSGVGGRAGVMAAVGLVLDRNPGAQMQHGWQPGAVLADRPMTKVWTIAR